MPAYPAICISEEILVHMISKSQLQFQFNGDFKISVICVIDLIKIIICVYYFNKLLILLFDIDHTAFVKIKFPP